MITAPLAELCRKSPHLAEGHHGVVAHNNRNFVIPKYVFKGPIGGGEPIRIGLFAGIHGDEPEGSFALVKFLQQLVDNPETARGFSFLVYPICNPTGFEAKTRLSATGKDLNREFWKNSLETEVRYLEAEIETNAFNGIITLHADDTSDGLYGFVRGATLTEHLLVPALKSAERVLPLNNATTIDGFEANNGVIRQCYDGVLGRAPHHENEPFEIILETPETAPAELQQEAFVLAIQTIVAEYRNLIAYAANL